MTERGGGQGFTVAPRTVGGDPDGGRRRRATLAVAMVLGFSLVLVAVALLGPHLAQRPSLDSAYFATPIPSAPPSTSPSAVQPSTAAEITPLPKLTLPDGVAPTGHVAVLGDSIQVLD